jgi:ABC-type dipeptide/oligopeptide/nickel transport system ATPase subunit
MVTIVRNMDYSEAILNVIESLQLPHHFDDDKYNRQRRKLWNAWEALNAQAQEVGLIEIGNSFDSLEESDGGSSAHTLSDEEAAALFPKVQKKKELKKRAKKTKPQPRKASPKMLLTLADCPYVPFPMEYRTNGMTDEDLHQKFYSVLLKTENEDAYVRSFIDEALTNGSKFKDDGPSNQPHARLAWHRRINRVTPEFPSEPKYCCEKLCSEVYDKVDGPHARLAWHRQINRVTFEAQMGNPASKAPSKSYCCEEQCFEIHDEVDGIACNVCKSFSYCRCMCVKFERYCCEEKCFKAPHFEVDGIACNVCKSYNFCKCKCVKFERPIFVPSEEEDSHWCCPRECVKLVLKQKCLECKRRECVCECKTYQDMIFKKERKNLRARKVEISKNEKEKAMLLKALSKNKKTRKNLVKWEAQMFDSLFHIPGNLNGLLNGATDMASSFKNVADTILAKIDEVAKFLELPKGFDLVGLLLSGLSLISAFNSRNWLSMTAALVAIARVLDIDYGKWFGKLQEMFARLLKKDNPTQMQAQMLDLTGIPFLQVFGTLGVTLTSMICTGGSTNITKLMKHLSEFGRAAIGWTKLADLFIWFKDHFLDVYYRNVKGKTLEQFRLEEKYPSLEALFFRCELLMSKDFKPEYIERDAEICNVIIDMDEDMNRMRLEAIRARDNVLTKVLDTYYNALRKVFVAARNSAVHSYKVRPAPTTLYIYGKSGVGKSNLVNYIRAAIYARKYKDDPKWTPNTVCHTRSSENEFWDGILPGQPIIQYDDIFQQQDSVANPNPEIMEIIRIKNEAPYHLHMSSIEDKKSCFMTAKYVIASSNVQHYTPVSIAEPQALQRRWDICVNVIVNPRYGKTSPCGKYHMICDKQLATHFKGKGFCKDIYVLDVYKMGDRDTVLHKNLSLDQFMDYFWAQSETTLEQSSNLNDSIYEMLGITREVNESDFSNLKNSLKDGRLKAQMADGNDENDSDSDDEMFETEDDLPRDQWLTKDADSKYDWDKDLTIDALVKCVPPQPGMLERARNRVKKLSERVKTEVAPVFAKAIKDFLCSRWFVYTVTIAGMMGYKWWTGHFSCKKFTARTLAALKVAECNCTLCGNIKTSSIFGTDAYAHELLIQMASISDHPDPAWYNWMLATLQGTKTECVTEALREHKNFSDSLFDLGYAESRETQTRFKNPSMRAESREVQTRGHPLKMRAEMKVPVYECRDGQVTFKAQMSDLNQQEQWESITNRNMVTLSTSGGEMNAVFITGRILLTVHHFVEQLENNGGDFTLVTPHGKDSCSTNLRNCETMQLTDAFGKPCDLVFIVIPTTASRRSIISKFHNANDMDRINEGKIVVSGLRTLNGAERSSVFSFCDSDFSFISGRKYTSNYGMKEVSLGLEYDLDTRKGDCGALVYTKSPFFSGKVVGMHVAGYKGTGAAIVISREMLERNLTNLNTSDRNLVDGRPPYSKMEAEMKVTLDESVRKDTLATMGNCLSLGTLPAVYASSQTQLRPSLVSSTLQTPDTKPAYLKPIDIDGEIVDPMIKGVQKVMNQVSPLDADILDICAKDVEILYHSNRPDKKVLTFEESVAGIEGHEYLAPLNRTSSPGYPYCLDNKGPGKREWFGYDDYAFSPEVKADVDELIEHCRNNRRGDVVWMACLKDERRPIAKVEQGKTRMFTGGPMHFTIAFRMYFLKFIENLMEKRIENEVGVGTNVYSLDWHKTGLSLTSKGEKVIAGDFSNFDGSLLQDVLWKTLDIINRWYDDGLENARIRSVLFEEVCNARVLVKDELIQWDHSQPSGNPGTVIINSMFNQIMMRYAYLLCKVENGGTLELDFRRHVSLQAFGDDNCLNISDEVIDWFNQDTITKALATVGLTYTDEAKTGVAAPYRTLEDIKYLKRGLIRDANGYFRAPLEKGVIQEMVNWIRGLKGSGKDETYENCEASMREAYFHGKDYYETNKDLLSKALLEKGVKKRLPEYSELHSFYNKQLFG